MKIGFTGPFGDNNFGDYAMLVNDIIEIYKEIDDVDEFVVFTYNISFTKKIVEKYLKKYSIKVIEIKYCEELHYEPNKSNDFQIKYSNYYMLPQEICSCIDNIEEIEEIVNTLDILILGGGGCMNYYWLAAHRLGRFASIIAPLIIGKRSNKKLITLGNTFGPWGNCKEFFEMLFQYLNFANLSVRDDLGSTSALAEIGQIGKISSIVDDLYFLQEELKIEKPKIINGKYIVLELYLSMREIEKQLTNIQEMVNGAKLYGVQVVFIAFGKKYGGEYQGQYLKDKIPDIVLYPSEEFVKIEDVRKLIQKAECVVCDRYHALVVSLSENTPCFMYLREIDSSRQYYFNKCYGLLQKKFANRFFDESEFLVLDLSIGLKRALDCTRINRQKVYFMDAENDLKLKCQRIKEIKKMIQFD